MGNETSEQIISGLGLSWTTLLIGGLALVLVLLQAYRWLFVGIPWRQRGVLLALRACWSLLLLLCLWNPVSRLTLIEKVESYPTLLGVVDSSESMALEGPKQKTQWAAWMQAKSDIEAATPEEVSEAMEWVRIGTGIRPLVDAALPVDSGSRILEGIEEAAAGVLSEEVDETLLFLLSDGQDTTDAIPLDVTSALRKNKVRLFPVIPEGEGFTQQKSSFARLVNVDLPSSLVNNNRFNLSAVLEYQSEDRVAYTLTLEKEGRVLESENLLLKGKGRKRYSFSRMATELGVHEYTVRLSPRDPNLEESVITQAITIEDKNDFRVLFVQGTLDWELRYVKRAIAENPTIYLDSLTRLNAKRFILAGDNEERSVRQGEVFTQLKDVEQRYDVVVLSNINPALMTPDFQRSLTRLVTDKGGGLLFFSGKASQAALFNQSELEEMLPVTFAIPSADVVARDNVARDFRRFMNGGSAYRNEKRLGKRMEALANKFQESLNPITLTEEGESSPIWQDASQGKQKAPAPPSTFRNYAYVKTVKPAATVLGVYGKEANAPLFAVQSFGAGRTAFLGIDTLWRWRMGAESAVRDYDRFWQQLLLWLGAGAEDGSELELDRYHYEPGDVAQIDLKYVADSTKLVLQATHDTLGAKPLAVNWERSEGRGTARFTVPTNGRFRIELLDGEKPVLTRLMEAKAFVDREKTYSGINLEFLQQLAAQTGGQVIQSGNYGFLEKFVTQAQKEIKKVEESPIWHRGWIFAVILLLYCIELILRRRFLLV